MSDNRNLDAKDAELSNAAKAALNSPSDAESGVRVQSRVSASLRKGEDLTPIPAIIFHRAVWFIAAFAAAFAIGFPFSRHIDTTLLPSGPEAEMNEKLVKRAIAATQSERHLLVQEHPAFPVPEVSTKVPPVMSISAVPEWLKESIKKSKAQHETSADHGSAAASQQPRASSKAITAPTAKQGASR